MQKALSSWRPRHSPHRERGERRHIAREGQAGGAAHRESGWKGGDVSFAVVTGETLCVPAVVPSRSVSSPPVGKVDDPRPVALTWGGAGVDHTPYPIPQAPHTRLGHYSPIANSQNSFLKACTEEFFWSEIFWNLPWIGCVRRGVWGMGYGVRIGRADRRETTTPRAFPRPSLSDQGGGRGAAGRPQNSSDRTAGDSGRLSEFASGSSPFGVRFGLFPSRQDVVRPSGIRQLRSQDRCRSYPIPHTPRSTHPTWSTLSHRDSQSSLE